MPTWTKAELDAIGNAEELLIQSRRADGSLRNPVIIWVVRVDDGLYVRAVGGPTSPWFKGTQTRHEGRISAGGIERDVTFAPVDPSLHLAIDARYRTKYANQPVEYVDPCLTPQAHEATLALIPT
jgi:hypothetical protein